MENLEEEGWREREREIDREKGCEVGEGVREHVVSDVADAILADRCCRYSVCTGPYLGDEKEDGTARQGKTRQKGGCG